MKRLLFWLSAIVLGVAVGAGGAVAAMGMGARMGVEQVGGWTINRLAGSTAADPVTRAIVARIGLLALAQEETIYLQMTRDEAGRPLREACRYELTGGALPARWWAVTIYAGDNYLPVNHDDAFSVDASRAQTDAAGRWRAEVQAERGDATNWISSRAAGEGFSLTLRLYNPEDAARTRPRGIPVPTLRTIGCAEDAP